MSAYVTDEPFLLEQAGVPYHVFSPRAGGIDFYNDVLFTTEEQVRLHPERVAGFLRACRQGWLYAFEHVDEMVEWIAVRYPDRHSRAHLAFEAEGMRELVMPEVVEPGYMNPGRWRHIAETYARLGMIPADASVDVLVAGLVYDPSPRRHSRWGYAIAGALAVMAMLLMLVIVSLLLRRGASGTRRWWLARRRRRTESIP